MLVRIQNEKNPTENVGNAQQDQASSKQSWHFTLMKGQSNDASPAELIQSSSLLLDDFSCGKQYSPDKVNDLFPGPGGVLWRQLWVEFENHFYFCSLYNKLPVVA